MPPKPAERLRKAELTAEHLRTLVHYDPAMAYELSHIVQDGLRRMYGASKQKIGVSGR